MSRLLKLLRKFFVLLIAVPIFVVGIILIPLPGPGLLLCLLALVILSLEFEAAKKHRDKIFQTLRAIINKSRHV